MKSHLLQSDADVQTLRDLLRHPDGKTVVDFEERIQIEQVRASTRIWQADEAPIAFAFVDDFSNLNFVSDPACTTPALEAEIVDWGQALVRARNAETGETSTLDAACKSDNPNRLAFLERHGFRREEVRSLGYRRPLDLLAVSPSGELTAFCICGFEENGIGFTDPIGVREGYKGSGLGKAIVTAGLKALQARGAKVAQFGTSSQNLAMQRLAERLGFELVSETFWFSKAVE